MADVVANLKITAVGADQAAAAAQTAADGLASIGKQSAGLEEKFSHRFSHIGLQLFAGDALRASGLGAETRQIIGTLNMAVTALGGAFGAAAGPIMLVATALAAGIGVYESVIAKHNESADSLKKLNDETEKSRGTLQDDIQKLEAYKETLGKLPPEVENLLQAKIRLRDFEDKEEIATLEKQVAAEQRAIEEEQKHADELNKQAGFTKNLNARQVELIASQSGLAVAAAAVTSKFKDYGKAIQDNNTALEKHHHDLAEAQVRLEAARQGTANWEGALKKASDEVKKTGEAAAKAAQQEAEEETRRYQHWAELHAKEMQQKESALEEEEKQDTDRYQHWAALHAKQVSEHKAGLSDIEKAEQAHSSKTLTFYQIEYQAGRTAAHGVADAFAQSFTKMIFEGASFMDSMTKAFENLAEQIIADIIRMEIEWMIFQAMTGGAGFGMGAFAEGGSFVANSPTPILVGEGGQPELVTITPFSQLGQDQKPASGGGQGGGTVINIGNVTTNVHGVNNPDQIADQVGEKIISRIRGRGELNFLRTA